MTHPVSDSFILRLCDEKHKHIDERFNTVWTRLNGQEKKLWAIIVMLFANMGALVALLLK